MFGAATEYTYYPGVDQPHSLKRGNSIHYYAVDYLGNVVGLIGSQHELANEYAYTPFGEREYAREDVPNALQFQARHYDPASKLYAWRARWYDPQLRRFISEDPIGLEGGINPYVFAENNPVNFRDPFGLETCYQLYRVTYEVTYRDGVEVFRREIGREAIGEPWCPGGGGGGSGGGNSGQQESSRRCMAPTTEMSGAFSGLIGGGFPGGFLGAGIALGGTTSGQLFIQFSVSAHGGVGLFAGYGGSIGGAQTAPYPARRGSTSSSGEFQANAGLGKAVGVSAKLGLTDDGRTSGFGAAYAPRMKYGQGWGAQASVGLARTRTYATRQYFRRGC